MNTPANIKTIDVPLTSLAAWNGNVRQNGNSTNLDQLKASILAHGLLQPLVVRSDADGYEVIAGKRRLSALWDLSTAGKLGDDFEVPCRLISPDASPEEISLAENVVREQMHPADQFEAFNTLIKKGTSKTDIAVRFGVTEGVVSQRLKLANVSPKIIKAYRDELLNLEQVQAYAVTDDQKRQERHYKDAESDKYQLRPDNIRRAMTDGEIPGTDKRALFVGIEAYEQAGGKIHRDLFADGPAGVYLLSGDLLTKLVSAKLQEEAARLTTEGWAWVKVGEKEDYDLLTKCQRRNPDSKPLDKADAAELKKLKAELDKLDEKDYIDLTDEEEERQDRLNVLIEQLERKQIVWPEKIKQVAGIYAYIGDQGQLEYEAGLVMPGDAKKEQAEAKGSKGSEKPGKSTADRTRDDAESTSQTLGTELVGHKTAAIAASLAINPDVALAAVVLTMAQDVLVRSRISCLNITTMPDAIKQLPASIANAKKCQGYAELIALQQTIKEELPRKDVELWPWLLTQNRDTLLRLLAFFSASTLSASMRNDDMAAEIAKACNVNMNQWFKPSPDNYFSRLNKAQLTGHVHEVCGADQAGKMEKLKHEELVTAASAAILQAQPNWLPQVLRLPQVVKESPKAKPAAPVKPTKAAKGDKPKATAKKAAAKTTSKKKGK